MPYPEQELTVLQQQHSLIQPQAVVVIVVVAFSVKFTLWRRFIVVGGHERRHCLVYFRAYLILGRRALGGAEAGQRPGPQILGAARPVRNFLRSRDEEGRKKRTTFRCVCFTLLGLVQKI